MDRGDVYRSEILLPTRQTGQGLVARWKYVVILSPYSHTDISVVICDTDKAPGRPYRAFEVPLGTRHGFAHATKIDCRWVYTFTRSRIAAGQFKFALDIATMQTISDAIYVGLQLD